MDKKNIWSYLFVAFILLFSAASVALADNNLNTTEGINQQALNVRFDHLSCKVDFTNTQIDIIASDIPAAPELSADKSQLLSDMDQLDALRNSSNKTLFDTFVNQNLETDFNKTTSDIRTVKKNFNSYNLSNDTKTAFKNSVKDALSTYNTCINNQEVAMTKVLENTYKNTEDRWVNVIGNMDKKHLDTTQLNATLSELISRLQQFQVLINSGNTSLIKSTLQDMNNEHLHLWANFDTQRITGYIDRLGLMAVNDSNITSELDMMRQKLAGLSEYTAQGHKYQNGELEKVWSTLKDTSKDLTSASKEMLQNRKNIMQNRIGKGPGNGNNTGFRNRSNPRG
jgi:hypothetical protein